MTSFHVDGDPVQQGSVRARVIPGGRAVVVHDNKAQLRSWRQDVAARATQAGITIIDGPVEIVARFHIARPASVSVKKRPLPSVRPDVDKLARGLLDALKGIAYADDAQVVSLTIAKVYAPTPGLDCSVTAVVTTDTAQRVLQDAHDGSGLPA